jgi:energy-coupling factor transport system ATP-binding protein
MNEPLVELKNVSFKYDAEAGYALHNVSFNILKGEWLAIVGHNGSGKSTLAKLLNGLHYPLEGSIAVGGRSAWFFRIRITSLSERLYRMMWLLV